MTAECLRCQTPQSDIVSLPNLSCGQLSLIEACRRRRIQELISNFHPRIIFPAQSTCAGHECQRITIKQTTIATDAKSMESNLSSMPPWPGRSLPISLIPQPRLMALSNRSPICASMDVGIEMSTKIARGCRLPKYTSLNGSSPQPMPHTTIAARMPPIMPPTKPITVLLGLV